MSYRIAGIDVHQRMLAVVIADVAADGEYVFERRSVGTTPEQLRALARWLVAGEVEEVVMESTAQHWRPVWEVLERQWQPTRRPRADADSRPVRCIWRRPSRIRAGAAESKTSPMRNGWSDDWSRTSSR